MTIIVTGASGFIGSHTIEVLIEQGYNVLAVDLNFKTLKETEAWNNPLLATVVLDITQHQFVNLVQQGDKILHLAAIAHFSACENNVQRAVHVNVEGTLNVVKCAIEKQAERIVYSSTGSVYTVKDCHLPIDESQPTEPENEYGITKKQAEDWVSVNGNLPYIILRYPYIYGVRKDWGAIGAFFKNIKEGKQPVIYGGNQSNDFTYVDDIVDANLLALNTKHTNQTFNIGTGRMSSILDVCQQCLKAVGSNMKPKVLPARKFDFPLFVYNINKARTILGYEPKWNIYGGIRDMAEQLRENGYFESVPTQLHT